MAHCEMCGTDMPVSGGRCALGHTVGAAAVAEPAPLPVEPAPSAEPVVSPSPLPHSPAALPPPPSLPVPAASEPEVVSASAGHAVGVPPPEVPSVEVHGALAVEPAPVVTPAIEAPFAGPLVELVVAEETKLRIPRPLGIFLAVVVLAAGVGGYVVFGGGGSAQAAVYSRVYKAGESHAYTMTMAMRGTVDMGPMSQPVNMVMNADVSERVLSVAPNGNTKVRFDVGFASVEANGQSITVPGKFSITAEVARDGRVLSAAGFEGFSAGGNNPMNGFFGGPSQMQPAFPSDKIAPGDSWTTRVTQKIPFGDKSIIVTTKNKLLRLETEHGMPVAVMRSVMEMPMNFTFTGADLRKMAALSGGGDLPEGAGMAFSGKMTFDAIQTVVRSTGRPIAVTGEGVFDVTMKISGPGVPGDMAMKMKMDLEVSFAEILGGQAA